MSLIQEALKRKRSEHDAHLSILPDPEQVARQLEEQVQRIKQQALQDIMVQQRAHRLPGGKFSRLIRGALVVLLIAGVIVGSMLVGSYLITRNSELAAWNQKLQVAVEQIPVDREIAKPKAASSGRQNSSLTAAERGVILEVPTVAAPGTFASGLPGSRLDEPPALSVSGEVRWPELTIGGVMTKSNSAKSSAVINDRVIFVNQRIKGVQLIEVQETGVTLEYQGIRRRVDVGQEPGDAVH